MGGKKAPTPPNPMLFFPTQSAQPDASYYQNLIPTPATPTQLVGNMTGAEDALSGWAPELGLTNRNQILAPEARSAYEQTYTNEYLKPQIEQLRANLALQGRDASTFGGAALGQALAAGANQALFAGEDLYNQRLNQLLAKRQSLFSTTGQMASNQDAANVQRGETLAKLAQNQQQLDNAFALNRYSAIQQPMWQAYNTELANKTANTQGKLGLLGSGMQLLGTAAGAYFGGPAGASIGSSIGGALKGMFGGGRNPGGGYGNPSGAAMLYSDPNSAFRYAQTINPMIER